MEKLECMIAVVIICILALIGLIIYVRAMFGRMENMINQAIMGEFRESSFDESQISKIENKLAQFLNSSSLNKKSVEEEKQHIKQIISEMSHQTKTPITNMILYSELLQESLEKPEDKDMLIQISKQAEKLNFLIQNLVKISRLETEVFQLRQEITPVRLMLQDIINAHKGKASLKNIDLSLEETEVKACFDYKWTYEALSNIVDNAIKYTPEGGKVHISVKEYEIFNAIIVKDNGVGIRETEHATIFNRFYRSEDAKEQEGIGVGLYLARKIITMEGGYIKVVSKYKEGATFIVYLKKFPR